jgi:poly(hydroxyalkanoate) depolymerase family esterase
MKTFKAGALRPVIDGARLDGSTAANDLVHRTLARHGLWPANGEMPGRDLMKGLTRTPARPRPATPPLAIPDGATFRSRTHDGRSGSRTWRHYIPASASAGVEGVVMMLHGCTQSPEDFALGTGMNALAETHRLAVLYPEQSRGANAQTCWNWFSRGDQRRERGEPEILAGIARTALAEHDVGLGRVFVAGLSAGAAMAVILGETHPDIFAAVGAHSGLPFGAATDLPGAYAAMAGTVQAAPAASAGGRAVPTIIFHGSADRTVHPANGAEIARRVGSGLGTQVIETAKTERRGGRGVRRTIAHHADGRPLSEHWLIEELGHAWSGGNPGGSYADPAGPDASAEMVRFFLGLAAVTPRSSG